MTENTKKPEPQINVRRSQRGDLERIRALLEAEEQRGVHENFLCNWSVIEKCFPKRTYVAEVGGELVGYQCEGIGGSPAILQVRDDWKRRGVGTALFMDLSRRRTRAKQWLLTIECAPVESTKFWKKMGFSITDHKTMYGVIAYTTVGNHERRLRGAKVRDVSISVFPECVAWEPDTPPMRVVSADAVEGGEGRLDLRKRLLFHELEVSVDDVVSLDLDGVQLFKDKIKRPLAADLGFKKISYGYYIDTINVMTSLGSGESK